MSKFKDNRYLKCRGDCCSCIKVVECISDNGEEAEVVAIWYEKVNGSIYRQASNTTRFKISKRDYLKWRPVNIMVVVEN